MIDWEQIARQHGMSDAEFLDELLMTVIIACLIKIDSKEKHTMTIRTSDDISDIELIVRRIGKVVMEA